MIGLCSVSNGIKYSKLCVHWIRETPGPAGRAEGFRSWAPALGQGFAEGKEGAPGQPSVPGSFSQAFQSGKVIRVKFPKSPGSALITLRFTNEETEVPRGPGNVSESTFRQEDLKLASPECHTSAGQPLGLRPHVRAGGAEGGGVLS